MEVVNKLEDISLLKDNSVICQGPLKMDRNCKISFTGTGNVLIFVGDAPINLAAANISFTGDNGLIVVNPSKYPYRLTISVGYGSSIYLGEDFYSATSILISAHERKNVYIGRECLVARNVCVRNADMHMIYDANSGNRINFNRSVYIGRHVWLGENALVLKGSMVGSGSIVGAGAVVTGTKTSGVNCIYAGNPAKCIQKDIFWSRKGTASITEEDMREKRYDTDSSKTYVYRNESAEYICDQLDSKLNGLEPMKRYEVLSSWALNGFL